MKNIKLSDIKKLGRAYFIKDVLWLGLSGTGVEFMTDATTLTLTLLGDNRATDEGNQETARLGVFSDGVRIHDMLMDKKEEKVTLSPDGSLHTFRIMKLSECAMSVIGIKAIEVNEDALIKEAPERALKIEFIGDSITCGYGVDMEDLNSTFTTATEDCSKAYALRTASKLNADHSLVSFSGYGIITGYTDDNIKREDQLVPTYYEKCGFSYSTSPDGPAPQDVLWDFNQFVPDIVVINLGTNDHSYCQDFPERHKEYHDEYINFLRTVRGHNPRAFILCVLGLMPVNNYKTLERAVTDYKKLTRDTEIDVMEIPVQTPEEGLVTDYHPTERSHERAAMLVSDRIAQILA